nr:unnamed protein product [Callosobruchus analis]
MAGKINRLDPT